MSNKLTATILNLLEKEAEKIKSLPDLSSDTLQIWDRVVYSGSSDRDRGERCIVVWFTPKGVRVVSLDDMIESFGDEDFEDDEDFESDSLTIKQVKYDRLIKVRDFI